MRKVYEWGSSDPRILSYGLGPLYQPLTGEEETKAIGEIPQVRHTFAYFDQDYGLQNEHQLSIAESTTSAKTVGWSLNQPYGYNLWGIEELSKIALERCISARCAIKLMGDLAEQGGFYSADSGNPNQPGYSDSAEALGIADKFGEAWVFNILTGANNASAIWAAQRVPDDHIHVTANSFTIRQMNLSDADNFMASSNIISFAQERGWYNASLGKPFDFTAAYAQDTGNDPFSPLYTGRRTWRFYQLLAPSQPMDPYLGMVSTRPSYPFSIKPDNAVAVSDIFSFLRDHFEGTEFDMSKGMGAGPFNNPMRFEGPNPYPAVHRRGGNAGSSGGWERAVSIYRTSFAFVAQARPHHPDVVGGRFWFSEDAPHGSVFVPFYGAQTSLPAAWTDRGCTQAKFSRNCAYWAFCFVNNWIQLKYSFMIRDVRAKQFIFERNGWSMLEELEADIMQTYKQREEEAAQNGEADSAWKPDLHAEILAKLEFTTNSFASELLLQWWAFGDSLISKFANGEITTGEGEMNQALPGYPRWWLANTEYVKWPGHTFIYPLGKPVDLPETGKVPANVTYVARATSYNPDTEKKASAASALIAASTTPLRKSEAVSDSPFMSTFAVAALVFIAFVTGLKFGESRKSSYEQLA